MNLKFYTSVAKGLKLKVRKFWGLITTLVEVTGEKLVPPILSRVNSITVLLKIRLFSFYENAISN